MFLNLDKFEANSIAAIDDAQDSITYGELVNNAITFEDAIPSRSVVFLLCRNSVGALNAYISMVENGVVPVMLSQDIDEKLLAALMENYKPQYICVGEDRAENFNLPAAYSMRGFVWLDTGNVRYEINDKLQLLMTTSGSTGSPKLVRYKKGNLEANAENVALAFGWTKNERPLCDLAMNYTMGLNVVNTHLSVGATLLLASGNITSGGYWKFVKEQRATNFTGVPFSYELLFRLRFFRMDLPYLTTLAEGGGKLTDKLFKEFAQYAHDNGKRFIATFGTTETAARMSMLEPEMALEKTGSIGKAIPNGKLVLFDDGGNEIEDIKAEGELGYYGPNVTMGYALRQEDLLKDDEFGGLYRTGDIARRDKDGYYYIVGRKSRFLKLLGYRVSLDQCENLIKEQFRTDCVCTGTDEKMTVYVTAPAETDKVREYISEKTSLFKTLFEVKKIDSIPRNQNGKVVYSKLG